MTSIKSLPSDKWQKFHRWHHQIHVFNKKKIIFWFQFVARWYQAIAWTNIRWVPVEPIGINFIKTRIKIEDIVQENEFVNFIYKMSAILL